MKLKTCLISIFLTYINALEFKYHSNEDVGNFLEEFHKNTTKDKSALKTTFYSIGESLRKRELWVLEITAAKSNKIAVPNIKFVGTIHGNEPAGREILLHFLQFLRDGYYQGDAKIQWLLNNTRIHFLPTLNPDGFAISNEGMCEGDHGRTNAENKDLNRNFPDYFHKNRIPTAPETRAIKKWMSEVQFVLSASLHSGALVANYPFDTVKERTSLPINPPSVTPDNDVFKHLAAVYSQNHLRMHKGETCEGVNKKFAGGITNGAEWYPFSGGMQDYNYALAGCMELTLEISCCKYPIAKDLPRLWEENKLALLNYCLEAHRGVRGLILDSFTRAPVEHATLKIAGRNMEFFTKKGGEFWRILRPGTYKLEISADGFHNHTQDFVVKDYRNSLPKLTFSRILLLNSSVSPTTTDTLTTMPTSVVSETISTDGTTEKIIISSATNLAYDDEKPIQAQQTFQTVGSEEYEISYSVTNYHSMSIIVVFLSSLFFIV